MSEQIPKLKLTLKRKQDEGEEKTLKRIKIKSTQKWELNHDISNYAKRLLNVILQVNEDGVFLSDPFLELVSKLDYPDYYKTIKNPIAIDMIQKKIDTEKYATIEDFKQDVQVMFSNCCSYNLPNSGIYLDAKRLESEFLAAYKLLQDDETGKKKLDPEHALAGEIPDTKAILAERVPPTPVHQVLMEHIKNGDSDAFEEALTEEAVQDINSLWDIHMFDTDYTWSYLHAACFYGNVKIIEHLISKGANVEIEDTWYQGRPLAWAAFGGHMKACKLLLEKYNAEKNAKNIHGQVAWDLVSDQHLPHWRGLFADKKPAPAPTAVTIKVPQKPVGYGQPRRSSSTYGTPQPAQGSQTEKLYPRRVSSVSNNTPISVQSTINIPRQQQPNYGQVVAKPPPTTPYATHVSQQREVIVESPLINSLLVAGNDDLFTLLIPIKSSDPENGYSGNFISLPAGVNSVNLRFLLDDEPFAEYEDAPNVRYTVTGFHSITYPPRVDQPASLKTDMLQVKSSGSLGEIVEIPVNLHDGINSIEITCTATAWGEGEAVYGLHQSQCLIVQKC